MNATFLSRFTPSMLTPEVLEALFVQREALAQREVEVIRESTLTPAKHHTLLIGPRGIGKTHFVSLIYHRIRAQEELRDRLLIAWLREEEWGVTTFLDLLLRIFRALLAEHGDAALTAKVEALYSKSQEAAERAAAALLKEFVGDRTLLILVENLDDLFNGLGDKGQRRLRAYLQKQPFSTILATSQSLFNGVALQTSPFYGFFRIEHLEEINLDDATRLLINIAKLEGDQELADFIPSPTGRARLRALRHLAGGNHRVYVIFSQFLTRESLDEFVDAFMRTLDDLTPYYQARMAWLSPQQRKVVELLCDSRAAVPVKEIAQRCFMTHQTASGQLSKLLEMGYVRVEMVSRESYYELREPLMRMCIEVKKNRGEPIRLLVDFLRVWYSREELQKRLDLLPANTSLEREYLLPALRTMQLETDDPRVAYCLKDLNNYVAINDWPNALQVTEELIAIRNQTEDAQAHAALLLLTSRYKEFIKLTEAYKGLEESQALIMIASFSMVLRISLLVIETTDVSTLVAHFKNISSETSNDALFHLKSLFMSLGALQSVGFLLSPIITEETAQRWRDFWQEVGEGRTEFEIPLRCMNAAISYREKQDRRALMTLPLEERVLLEQMLAIAESPSQPPEQPAKRTRRRISTSRR